MHQVNTQGMYGQDDAMINECQYWRCWYPDELPVQMLTALLPGLLEQNADAGSTLLVHKSCWWICVRMVFSGIPVCECRQRW